LRGSDVAIPVSEWQALVVNEVMEDDLLRGLVQGDSAINILPVKNVKLSVDDLRSFWYDLTEITLVRASA
jgi:hypothetical protein